MIILTVRPNVNALCIGGGGAGPMVPIPPIHPMKIKTAVPITSPMNIVSVPSWSFHIESASKYPLGRYHKL